MLSAWVFVSHNAGQCTKYHNQFTEQAFDCRKQVCCSSTSRDGVMRTDGGFIFWFRFVMLLKVHKNISMVKALKVKLETCIEQLMRCEIQITTKSRVQSRSTSSPHFLSVNKQPKKFHFRFFTFLWRNFYQKRKIKEKNSPPPNDPDWLEFNHFTAEEKTQISNAVDSSAQLSLSKERVCIGGRRDNVSQTKTTRRFHV